MTKSPAEVDPEQAGLSTAHPPYAPAVEPAPKPPQPQPPDGEHETLEDPAEEVDVLWASYSGWTMAPSWAVCILLTGMIIWGAWLLVPRGFIQGTVLGLGGAVWLVQVVRWAYRVFGYNYRLTTRRVFADRGFLYAGYASLDLASVARVQVQRSWMNRLLGVGQVWVVSEDKTKPPLVLEGVRRPLVIAERIQELIQAADETRTNSSPRGSPPCLPE